MPRTKDIGWAHCTMIGGRRHHLQCNYCNRVITGGGITRFKDHIAGIKGEIRGCEAVAEEVREIFQKQLALEKVQNVRRKKNAVDSVFLPSAERDTRSDETEREIAATGLESLRTSNEGDMTPTPLNGKELQTVEETQEFLIASSATPVKSYDGSAPPRATDPGWAHGMMIDGVRYKVKCNYCNKVIVGGGITRLKQHLAGEKGNIAPCEEVPEAVKLQFQNLLGGKVHRTQIKHEALDTGHISPASCVDNGDDGYGMKIKRKQDYTGTPNYPKKQRKNSHAISVHVTQLENQSFTSKEVIDQADTAVAKFMYDVGIPLSASNSCYFQKMADAISTVGPGYKMPSYDMLTGKLLNKNVHEARKQCSELKKCWEMSGCSVLVDRFLDKRGRSVINFFVYSSKGTVFLKSADTTDNPQSSEALFSLFNSVVQEVGPDNVVNFVTDTEPNFKAAGKALMAKYSTFFWSACSAHCIDLMLEKIAEADEIKEVLRKAKQITRFIYNDSCAYNMMRKSSDMRDIIQLGNTRHESFFLTLKNITSLREPLREMLTSASGKKTTLSIQVAEIMEDPQFWSLCDQTLKATEPLLTVLSLLDCEDRPSIGYIYDAIDKAKRSIILAFDNQESDYLPYLNVIDGVWQEELYSPLHAAGFYLNPSIFYSSRFSSNKVFKKGLLDCIEVLEPNLSSQVTITSQTSFYEDAVGDFGRPVAVRGRESLAPATWWSLYASDYPELQKLALRVLNQACSISKSQRNWIMFERIHGKKSNLLEHQRLNDLIFVHHNLHLKERQESSKKRSTTDTQTSICLEAMDPDLADWVEYSIDSEDSVMDPMFLGEKGIVSSTLFGSDLCDGSVDDDSIDDIKIVIDEHEDV